MTLTPVSFDDETFLITDRVKAPALVCTSWATRRGQGFDSGLMKWDDVRLRDQMADWLEGDFLLVGANIAFDFGVTINTWPELIPLVFDAYERNKVCDVQVSCKLVDNAAGELHRHPVYTWIKTKSGRKVKSNYALAALAKRFLGKDLDKETWRMGYEALRYVPLEEWPEGARQYAIDDAVSTLEVHEALQLGYPELLEDQFRQTRHAFWLHLVGLHGIRTDPERVRLLKERLVSEREDRVKALIAAGLIHPKKKKNTRGELDWSRNVKAAKARMVAVMGGFQNCKPTASGDVCLDKEVCVDCGDDLLASYAKVTSLGKRLSTEIRALEEGEIHPRFDSFKTTGRTGCSEPNIQNLPRDGGERECFIPREGFVFCDADYDMLELRTWAQACLEIVGESTLADELNQGTDVHLSMACELLPDAAGAVPTYEDLKKRKKEERVKEARQTSKPVNFGLPGGMGAARLVGAAKKDYGIVFPADPENDWDIRKDKKGNVISRKHVPGLAYARALKAAWMRKRPEAGPYFAWASENTRTEEPEDEEVEAEEDDGEDEEESAFKPPTKRRGSAVQQHLFVKRYRGGLGYCDFCNNPFQGLGGDVAKDAGWRVTRACWDWTQNDPLYGSRIVNFPHDQIITETPIAVAHEAAMSLARHMVHEDIWRRWLPDVPPTTTPCLATCFSKLAEPYYDEAGKLIPWSVEGEVAKRLGEAINHVCRLWEQTKKEKAA